MKEKSLVKRLWEKKRVSLISLVAGLICVGLAFVLPTLVYKTPLSTFVEGSHSIISRYYMDIILNRMKVILIMFGALIIASALFCVFFRDFVHTHCTHRTSGLCLLLSMIIALGLYCALIAISCIVFKEIAVKSMSFISSIIFGILSVVAFCFLFKKYVRMRAEKNSSLKGITIDFIFAIIYVIPFFTIYDSLHAFLGKIIP